MPTTILPRTIQNAYLKALRNLSDYDDAAIHDKAKAKIHLKKYLVSLKKAGELHRRHIKENNLKEEYEVLPNTQGSDLPSREHLPNKNSSNKNLAYSLTLKGDEFANNLPKNALGHREILFRFFNQDYSEMDPDFVTLFTRHRNKLNALNILWVDPYLDAEFADKEEKNKKRLHGDKLKAEIVYSHRNDLALAMMFMSARTPGGATEDVQEASQKFIDDAREALTSYQTKSQKNINIIRWLIAFMYAIAFTAIIAGGTLGIPLYLSVALALSVKIGIFVGIGLPVFFAVLFISKNRTFELFDKMFGKDSFLEGFLWYVDDEGNRRRLATSRIVALVVISLIDIAGAITNGFLVCNGVSDIIVAFGITSLTAVHALTGVGIAFAIFTAVVMTAMFLADSSEMLRVKGSFDPIKFIKGIFTSGNDELLEALRENLKAKVEKAEGNADKKRIYSDSNIEEIVGNVEKSFNRKVLLVILTLIVIAALAGMSIGGVGPLIAMFHSVSAAYALASLAFLGEVVFALSSASKISMMIFMGRALKNPISYLNEGNALISESEAAKQNAENKISWKDSIKTKLITLKNWVIHPLNSFNAVIKKWNEIENKTGFVAGFFAGLEDGLSIVASSASMFSSHVGNGIGFWIGCAFGFFVSWTNVNENLSAVIEIPSHPQSKDTAKQCSDAAIMEGLIKSDPDLASENSNIDNSGLKTFEYHSKRVAREVNTCLNNSGFFGGEKAESALASKAQEKVVTLHALSNKPNIDMVLKAAT